MEIRKTFRLSKQDLAKLEDLKRTYELTTSGALRVAIRQAWHDMENNRAGDK